jgi:host factor-I protein
MSSRVDATGGVSHLQETFLNGARRERLQVVIRLMDGTEVDGRIKSFDRFSVLVEHDGADHMLFKHAIASIRPFASGAADASS